MTAKMSAASEIDQLRKKLLNSRSEISELKDQLKEQEDIRYNLTVERDNYRKKIITTKDTIKRMDEIVQMKVNSAINEERENNRKTEQELYRIKEYLKQVERRRDELEAKNLDYDDQLKDLRKEFDFFEGKTGHEAISDNLNIIKELKDDKKKLITQLNDLSENLEDILAENRILRKMNNIPDNWGCEPQKRIIKLQDKETVFEYKRLVKILQEDNYNLEKERAKLKHRVKQLSILSSMKPDEKYKDLTPDQLMRLNEFIIRLRSGDPEEDKSMYELIRENQDLKKELDILQNKGYNVIKQQLEAFFRDNKGTLFAGINLNDSNANQELTEEQKKFMANLKNQQDQMKGLIENIWGGMASRGPLTYVDHDQSEMSAEYIRRFGPPKVTGLGTGFSSKFDTKLSIPLAGSSNPKDLPALQLQLVELFALNDRKDSQIKTLENELERAYTKVRKYLMIQDQLYLNYSEELQDFRDKRLKIEQELIKAKEGLRCEQIINENHQKTFKTLKLEADPMANQVVNLQKKLALLEVENFKLAKKYSIVAEQEKQLRDAYHKIEEGYTEREKFAVERICKLKEWQIKAINEIKFLYNKFRDAVPLGEYQNISRELFIVKQKFADLMEKCNRFAVVNARLQTKNRELLISGEKLKLYEEIKIDVENELEVIKKRLELVDPLFKWENSVFNKVISVLKLKRVSPRQVFDYFDKDGSGKLSSKEFLNALEKMGIGELNPKEKEVLLKSVDADMNGTIDYREFCRKCGRFGVISRSKEDEIVFIIDDTLRKHDLDISAMFEIMDKKGKGVITKEDFKDTLVNSRVKIEKKDLDNFTDLFWRNRDDGINYRDFIRMYNKFKVKLDEEEDNKEKAKGKIEITEEMIERQKWIFDKLNQIFKKNDIKLKEAFEKIDNSSDKKITRIELRRLFDHMGVTVSENELEVLFRQIDFDNSGAITFNEFEIEFNRIVNTPLENLIALLNDQKQKAGRKFGSGDYRPVNEDYLNSLEITSATKYNILEARAIQLERRNEMFRTRLEKSENSQIMWERDYDILEKKYFEINEKYQEILQREQSVNTQMVGSLTKEKSEKIVLESERNKEEIVDLRAAIGSFKSLFEIATNQTKVLKLANKRSRDEEENLMFALRELQSNSIDKMKLGRIYYILMLSRWQEAAIGLKYDHSLNDLRILRLEFSEVESRLKREEDSLHESETKLREKSLQVEKFKQDLENKVASCISLTRAEEISKALQDITDEKTDVEEKYMVMYSEQNNFKNKIAEYEARMDHSEQMLHLLRNATDSEVFERLIEMSDKLSQIRRSELRSKREAEENSEKANYAERRATQLKRNIVDLEDQLSTLESNMHRKEEEWRRADNERQKKFFDAQFVNFETEKRYIGYGEDKGFVIDKLKNENLSAPPVGEYIVKKSDVRMMQAKIRNYEEEINNLQTQIISKERQLDRIREWKLEDDLLSEDEKMKDVIDGNKSKYEQHQEAEQKEMAQAAYKTIKTLQELIETKTTQCKNKEEIIKQMQEKLNLQKQQDTSEIVRLNEELNKALKQGSSRENSYREVKVTINNGQYETIPRRELENICYQKDDQIENLSRQIATLTRDKELLLQTKGDHANDKPIEFNDISSSRKVRALQIDVDRLTKEIRRKEKYEKKLNATINEITDKLVKLEQMKGITKDEMNIANITSKNAGKVTDTTGNDDKIVELDKMLKAKENRLLITTQRLKTLETDFNESKAELLKLKESETSLKQEVKNNLIMKQKLIDDFQSERRELKKLTREAQKLAETGGAQATGANLELKLQIKQLEKEIVSLKSQARPVIAYNSENKSFEYIGEPIPLKIDETPSENIEELLNLCKDWLKTNNRITTRTIFNSFDYNKSGYLNRELLIPIFSRFGIKLHQNEADLLFNCLKDEEAYQWKYKPLVIELTTGPSQIEFIPPSTQVISKLVLAKDYDYNTFLNGIDINKSGNISKEELKLGLEVLFPKEVKPEIVDDLYKIYKYKGEDKVDPEKLSNAVFQGTLAMTIKTCKNIIEEKSREYSRDAREGKLEETKGLNLDNEFSKIDREHDGVISHEQFKKLLLAYDLKDLKENAVIDLIQCLDSSTKGLVSLPYIKNVLDLPRIQNLGDDELFGLEIDPKKDTHREREDLEIEDNTRKALRRIYRNNNLIERLGKQLKQYDRDYDQVMSRAILKQSIIDVTRDVHEDDINYIVQYADKRNKGYFSPDLFMDNITTLAQDEAKKDSIFRRVGNIVKHKGINLEKELNKQTKNSSGVIDSFDFMRALRDIRIGLDGNDMDDLVRYACNGEKYIDIKAFCKRVESAMESKPISITLESKSKKNEINKKKGEMSETEQKRIQQKIQILTNQLIDTKKELEKVEKNAQDWKAIAEKNEKSLNILSDKLLEPSDKLKKVGEINAPANATKLLKNQLRQQEKILELEDKLQDLFTKNEELEKSLLLEAKAKNNRLESEIKDMLKRLNSLKSENLSLQNQIDKLASTSSQLERNEEAENAKQMNIKGYEARTQDLEQCERELREELLKAEHQNLDMKFDNDNNISKVSKLKDKIYELENYINIYTQLPPSMISKANANKDFDIEKELMQKPGASKRPAAELEKVIEGLKRVINTQKSELENLKKKESRYKAAQEKVSTNKLLKDEISTLENELKAFEVKDKKVEDLEVKSQKLSEANKLLVNDIRNEQKRYEFLEAKYKELLIKYNITSKDLEKKQDSLFTMSTGANKGTYQDYLLHGDQQD